MISLSFMMDLMNCRLTFSLKLVDPSEELVVPVMLVMVRE